MGDVITCRCSEVFQRAVNAAKQWVMGMCNTRELLRWLGSQMDFISGVKEWQRRSLPWHWGSSTQKFLWDVPKAACRVGKSLRGGRRGSTWAEQEAARDSGGHAAAGLRGQCQALAVGAARKRSTAKPGNALQEGCGKHRAPWAKCPGKAPVPSPHSHHDGYIDRGKWGWRRARNSYNSLCSCSADQHHLPTLSQGPDPPYAAPCTGEYHPVSPDACMTFSPVSHSSSRLSQSRWDLLL